ncbi:helix-turn-helix domain-containing protein [Granulicoccus phenolivorans]|uniref:helix-turn-helix domain-containing protein n=1 Tax=Granulicoccus phenolivorans TaxID=266854 RepID=UPI0003FF89C5|nr:helix-turn-helix domain-containing protein [Granulicoccus phenolivorans]
MSASEDKPENKGADKVAHLGDNLAGVKFLTVAEVAAIMRVSKMSVYRLIHGGDLEAVRFGRSFRVPETAVNDYLKGSYYDVG